MKVQYAQSIPTKNFGLKFQVDQAKKQLEYHFIFNALNTLSCLISRNPVKALQFNDSLNAFYRQLVLTNSHDFIPLSQELEILQEYYELLQIKHGDSLTLHLEYQEILPENRVIIPFSLQMLLENAIKHNRFSSEEPLHVHIEFFRNKIIVHNPIHEKPNLIASTKIGLMNLNTRNQLIFQKNIKIIKTNHEFIVEVPIVKKQGI